MQFQLNISLTEDDYLAFNYFHSLESSQAQKILHKRRNFFVAVIVGLIVLLVLIIGWTAFVAKYAVIAGLYTILFVLFDKKIGKRNIKAAVKKMKENGKLPIDPFSTYEFYEDKFVEITPSSRTETNYDSFEKICIVHDRYIFLYINSVSAYTLPLSQVRQQLSEDNFLNFLVQKCAKVERY